MGWDFSEDSAFISLCEAFKESGENSAVEFLANGEGEYYYQEVIQNAAGEGIDLSDCDEFKNLQYEIVEMLDKLCSQ